MEEHVQYPAFRKLANGKVLYKINSKDHFEELQPMGKRYLHFSMQAKQYPELLRIQDMLQCLEGHYVEACETEWELAYALGGKPA
ncbi:MAG: hypothetical protein EP338_07435 [Bacteroidetes bacterium]|nr:MAG: hypothetical protein EP338_07435 [Bacteroidota bacterium]